MTLEEIEIRWGGIREITKSEMRKEVFKTGGKVFQFASIIPLIHTFIVFFAVFILVNIDTSNPYWIYSYNYSVKTNLFFVFFDWLYVVLPFTISAMIWKRLLFTKYREKIKWMPIMTGVLCTIIGLVFSLWFIYGGL